MAGHTKAFGETLGEGGLDLVALAILEGDGRYLGGAIFAYGESKAGGAVLAAAEHDDGLDVLFVGHVGKYSTSSGVRQFLA